MAVATWHEVGWRAVPCARAGGGGGGCRETRVGWLVGSRGVTGVARACTRRVTDAELRCNCGPTGPRTGPRASVCPDERRVRLSRPARTTLGAALAVQSGAELSRAEQSRAVTPYTTPRALLH